MKTNTLLSLLSFALLYVPTAQADSFGSGANQFDIEFVTIGNPNNPDDTTGNPDSVGKVEYNYRIGKFESASLQRRVPACLLRTRSHAAQTIGVRRASRRQPWRVQHSP